MTKSLRCLKPIKNLPGLSIFILFLLYGKPSFAQVGLNDPLKKPAVWAKLKEHPEDARLWVEYLGKPIQQMTTKEKESMHRWQQELMLQLIADREAIMTSQDKKVSAAPKVIYIERKHLAELEAQIRQENEEMAALRTNVLENFVLLEELFEHTFKELGAEYRYYHQVHPDRKYNELRWIEEQEMRIKMLKEEKIKELRKIYVVRD